MTSLAELPFLPIATDALLADAGDLPNVLFGAYCRLLFRWWREGAAPEKEERRLARWAGLTVSEFQEIKEFLTETPDGWIQGRLAETYARQLQRSQKARASANARHSAANALENQCERSANAVLTINHEPLSLSNDKLKRAGARKSKSGKKKATPVPIPAHGDAECAPGWKAMVDAFGDAAIRGWFMIGDRPALKKNGAGFVIEAQGPLARDRIDQQYGARLNQIFGRRGWSINTLDN